jgi:hypothetical protein
MCKPFGNTYVNSTLSTHHQKQTLKLFLTDKKAQCLLAIHIQHSADANVSCHQQQTNLNIHIQSFTRIIPTNCIHTPRTKLHQDADMIPPPPLCKFSSSKLCPHLQARHKGKNSVQSVPKVPCMYLRMGSAYWTYQASKHKKSPKKRVKLLSTLISGSKVTHYPHYISLVQVLGRSVPISGKIYAYVPSWLWM